MKKLFNKNESGRSMVEMLGVLAIIGVLSVGGIAGYRMAMEKISTNKLHDIMNLFYLSMLEENTIYEDMAEATSGTGTLPSLAERKDNMDLFLEAYNLDCRESSISNDPYSWGCLLPNGKVSYSVSASGYTGRKLVAFTLGSLNADVKSLKKAILEAAVHVMNNPDLDDRLYGLASGTWQQHSNDWTPEGVQEWLNGNNIGGGSAGKSATFLFYYD